MRPIIRVEQLGKQYRLGSRREAYATLRESLSRAARAPFARARHAWRTAGQERSSAAGNGSTSDAFWALKDVSFDVTPGEVLGIIGRNGAGKSTLLKLLSRITEPTTGRVELYGRVASLLEVGTGFHPELTGRENVYLNGAVLGMGRREIDRKFDEIVEFSGVEQFLDTPLKRYSSGMQVRLAFAVAAHLEPEILIVDEVLAVGDAEFQRKCLGKMQDVAHSGRTVLFVSHNMAAVKNLCARGILLQNGLKQCDDAVAECIDLYTRHSATNSACWRRGEETSHKPLAFESVSLDLHGEQPELELEIQAELRSYQPHRHAFVAVDFADVAGVPIMQALPTVTPFINPDRQTHNLRLDIALPPLIPGRYSVSMWVGPHHSVTYDWVQQCAAFEITTSPVPGNTVPHSTDHGHLVPPCRVHYCP